MEWPQETRELHNHHFNSTNWTCIKARNDDIVIGSWAKSGTTLTQQLVGQLISGGDPSFAPANESPWVDFRMTSPEALEKLEQQQHRRFMKTHLPTDALPYDPNVKYIYCARDGRDTVWSLYNHHCQGNDVWYDALNGPGLVGPPMPRPDPDIRSYFLAWLRGDGAPWWPFFSHVRSWWRARQLPNVLVVHFSNLRSDLPGEARRIASFLGLTVPEDRWPAILEHCSLEWMRRHGEQVAPANGAIFKDGARGFLYKGTNGRWRDTLTAEDCAEYEAAAAKEMGPELAAWLATGHPADSKAA